MRLIIFAAAEAFGVSVEDLRARRRRAFPVRAAACLLARELTGKTYPQLGRILGGRDHTTIMNAVERAEQMLATDPDFAVSYAAAKRAVETIATSKLADALRDDEPATIAARICEHPSQAARISTWEILLMAARLVMLEELAADAFKLLNGLDLMVDQPNQAASLRAHLNTRIDTVAEQLASLGYANQAEGATNA
ncbi:helix-turn-helix domain-containing protein [Rhodopseudomonas sp. AAP120]|uniref:helix-turn-helix domain-containing protein n=1 Tax=Rhodopseudomonas sp. AAP120 TaxID=1523430 RepID=UPI001AEBB57C|nr:helix-turn-helix domain-containing protein [Rhodopseudomonas sp. AAP120]